MLPKKAHRTVIITPPNAKGKGNYAWTCIACGQVYATQDQAAEAERWGCVNCKRKGVIERVRTMPKRITPPEQLDLYTKKGLPRP